MTAISESRSEEAARRAKERFGHGRLYCAESVLATLAELNGIEGGGLIPRIASGFCSGRGRTSGTCGALSGAVMALGLALGRDHGEQSLEACYAAVQRLERRFVSRFGGVGCAELTGCDLASDEGQAEFSRRGLIDSLCAEATAEAARIAQLVIEQQAGAQARRGG